MRKTIVMAAAAILAGCQGKPISEMSYTETRALAVEINQRCRDQGLNSEMPEWKICVQQEITRENSIRNRAARKADSGVICNRVGFSTICM